MKKNKRLPGLVIIGLALLIATSIVLNPAASEAASEKVCRFGINSVTHYPTGYDLSRIGIGGYLDWRSSADHELPDSIEYVRVLRLRDDLYPDTISRLAAYVNKYPGSVWLVGNEPDTKYGPQDELTPRLYADRFYEVATTIRGLDSSAKIGIGNIVQPTPIRTRYLNRVWTRLVELAGSNEAVSDLIDIWAIHAFILNEDPTPGSWGTGVPPGFENDNDDAIILNDYDQTHSITLFSNRVTNFRLWMSIKGERDKPLWITEYGSLFPPIDPPGGPDYVNVSDQDTIDFMLNTFDFLLSAVDSSTGYPADGDRLVQRWFWYSLNENRYNFGGTLFDPDNNRQITSVGEAFQDYQAIDYAEPDLFPLALSIRPISFVTGQELVNYELTATIGNDLTANTGSGGNVTFIIDDPFGGGKTFKDASFESIRRCGGTVEVAAFWPDVQPLTTYTIDVLVRPTGVDDSNPANNQVTFQVYADYPFLFIPLTNR